VLSVVPFLGIWAAVALRNHWRPWFSRVALASVAFLLVTGPWLIRDYRIFHQPILFRDGLGLELYIGNNGYTRHWANGKQRPSNNPAELAEFKQGELAYVAHKKAQALDFIKGHPGWYAVMSLRRAVYLWTGFWSLDRSYLSEEEMDPANIAMAIVILSMVMFGIRRLWNKERPLLVPFLIVMAFFPLVYCLTHPEVYYMRPVDPFLAMLAAYGVTRTRRVKKSVELKAEELVTV
jgi:hypothetical protein